MGKVVKNNTQIAVDNKVRKWVFLEYRRSLSLPHFTCPLSGDNFTAIGYLISFHAVGCLFQLPVFVRAAAQEDPSLDSQQ